MAKDVLLNNDLSVAIINGDFAVGNSIDQEVQLILEMAQGELKEDPLIGADLFRLIHSNTTDADLKQAVKLQLARDGKDYARLKERLKLVING